MIVPCWSRRSCRWFHDIPPFVWWVTVTTFGSSNFTTVTWDETRMALQARFPTSDLVALLALVPPTETLSKSLVAAGVLDFCWGFWGEICVDLFFLNKDIGAYPAKRGPIVLGFFQIPTQCSPQLKNFEQPTLSMENRSAGAGGMNYRYIQVDVSSARTVQHYSQKPPDPATWKKTGDFCCKPMVCWILRHPEK